MNRSTTTLLRLARLVLGGPFLLGAALAATADDTPAWIAKSNIHAQVLLDVLAKFSPAVALGQKFNRQAFNDFIIGQSLLPPELLGKAVREQFIPAQAGK